MMSTLRDGRALTCDLDLGKFPACLAIPSPGDDHDDQVGSPDEKRRQKQLVGGVEELSALELG